MEGEGELCTCLIRRNEETKAQRDWTASAAMQLHIDNNPQNENGKNGNLNRIPNQRQR
jgi:hypothetical protein